MKVVTGYFCLVLAVTGLSEGSGELQVISLTPLSAKLVFKTANSGTIHHNYRVEAATSLVSEAWSVQCTVGCAGAGEIVTNQVPTNAASMFYRVVATSNSATFVDGPYMAVDISGGTNALSYPVEYYCRQADVPGGANSDTYKKDKILLRLIPKGVFTMGLRATDCNGLTNSELHTVTLTKDFYMGVFEVTQRQWELVMGGNPSYFNNASYYASRPVECVSYYHVRESSPTTDDPAVDWPNNNAVNSASFMGKLRAKTGLSTFDLPTEAQWEYACRAGTTTALNTGYDLTLADNDPRLNDAGRYGFNGGLINGTATPAKSCTPDNGTAKVGTYLPNAWGLYDMHGNVFEWCLDWYGGSPGTVSDPKGPSSGVYRMDRGACWSSYAVSCCSGLRPKYVPSNRSSNYGFRLARTLP
jgi:formylglycine-generating enzyme required for sulfatase activity